MYQNKKHFTSGPKRLYASLDAPITIGIILPARITLKYLKNYNKLHLTLIEYFQSCVCWNTSLLCNLGSRGSQMPDRIWKFRLILLQHPLCFFLAKCKIQCNDCYKHNPLQLTIMNWRTCTHGPEVSHRQKSLHIFRRYQHQSVRQAFWKRNEGKWNMN